MRRAPPRALVVYCHPDPASFTAAIRDVVLEGLRNAGAEVRLADLYAAGFAPALTPAEWSGYAQSPQNRNPVAQDCADVLWCDTLIFIYPTWWYGLPAMLKGWLDRVLLPDVAFRLPEGGAGRIEPGLRHITALGVFTTCGASFWLTAWVGAPGRRTLLRGLGLLCAKPLRRVFAAQYRMDASTPASRAAHLARVRRKLARLIGAQPPEGEPA